MYSLTVQYLYENTSTFSLTINREDDSSYYKCEDIMEEEVALAVLEQWLKMGYLSGVGILFQNVKRSVIDIREGGTR